MDINPGKKIYYTKDNVKYCGHIIYADDNKNVYRISLDGFGDSFEAEEDEVEDADDDHRSFLTFIEVNELPTEDIDTGAVYLLPAESATEDHLFDEYVYVNNAWEKLGTPQIEINLDGYYTKDQVDDLFDDVNNNIESLIDGLQDDTNDITALKNRVSATESDITNIENTVQSLIPAIGDNTLNISSLQTDVSSLETDMSLVKTTWKTTIPTNKLLIKSINMVIRDSEGYQVCYMTQRVREGIINPMTSFYFDGSTSNIIFVRTNFNASNSSWVTAYRKLIVSGSSIIYTDVTTTGFTIETYYEVLS